MKIHPVILFDGVCNFCDGAINYVIKRDKKAVVKFTTLQSFAGQQLLEEYGLPVKEMKSFILIENGKAYDKSGAAIRTFRYMGGLWPAFYVFILVPKFIRDVVYDFIAKRRYKWFGQKDQCMIPTPEINARFLV
ncbi:MAG: thiol-disulfide oxidoreductase DCC family protein [Ferruginibacter sp.]